MGPILINTVNLLFGALILVIFARVILSFLPNYRFSQLGRVVYDISDPILRPIQNIMPSTGMLDFSPMIALILLTVLQQIIVTILSSIFPY